MTTKKCKLPFFPLLALTFCILLISCGKTNNKSKMKPFSDDVKDTAVTEQIDTGMEMKGDSLQNAKDTVNEAIDKTGEQVGGAVGNQAEKQEDPYEAKK